MTVAKPRIRRSPEVARALILESAEQVMKDAELGGLTVEAITRQAGMTRSAFYRYFPSLDELVQELLESIDEKIRAALNPWLDNAKPVNDERAEAVRALTEMYSVSFEHRDTVRVVMHAASASAVVYDQWQVAAVNYYSEKAERFIAHQVKARRSRVEDIPGVARTLILMTYIVWVDTMRKGDQADPIHAGQVTGSVWNATIFGPET